MESKLKQIELLLREVIKEEIKINNSNDSFIGQLSDEVIEYIVNHWYINRTKHIFYSDDMRMELDEYLNIEELKF